MKPIIQVSHLSKKYRYGESQPYYTFRDTLAEIFKSPVQLFNKNQKLLKKNEFWALKNVSFNVQQGETVGIIGPNGAGKSTILKILSRITPPTTGQVALRGRVGSLLEVGTGFHYELTGRENIFLNGSILGMTKNEINKKFDDIVNFSGVGKFLDTPVKRYSSGMFMRLAFSVAANLDSEILVVDEVLAVGDSEFQKKCMGKMEEINKNKGKTIIFVSHNMGAVAELCKNTIVMENGRVTYMGATDKAISRYLAKYNSPGSIFKRSKKDLTKGNQFVSIFNTNFSNTPKSDYSYVEDISIQFEVFLPDWNDELEVALFPCDKFGRRIFMIEIPLRKYYSGNSHIKFVVKLPAKTLASGEYSWETYIHVPMTTLFDHQKNICSFRVNETGSPFLKYGANDCGCVYPPSYMIEKVK